MAAGLTVCVVSCEYPQETGFGGTATYAAKLTRRLASLGHKVHVISVSPTRPRVELDEGVVVHRLPVSNLRSAGVIRSRQVNAAIRAIRPDVVQAFEWLGEGYWFSRRKTCPLVTRLALPTNQPRVPRPGLRHVGSRLRAHLEYTQTVSSDAIVAPSFAGARVVSKAWGIPLSNIDVVHTGVDFAQRYAESQEALPAELTGVPYVLYYGWLEERKGVHLLAEALAGVMARHPTLHAVFAGNSRDYQGRPMEALVRDRLGSFDKRLVMLPRLAHPALYPVIRHATAVAFPSLWENFSNGCLEAMDMGKAIVATQGSGYDEMMTDGESGLLTAATAPALETALERVVADDGLRATLEAGVKRRSLAFGVEAMTDNMLAIYHRAIAQAGYLRPRKIAAAL